MTSAGTSAVANRNDAPSGNVTIDETAPAEDGLLTAANTLADEDGLGTVSYQWQRDGIDIPGAINSSYTVLQSDVGSVINVTASYTDGHGTVESVSSENDKPVVNVNDQPEGSVNITGLIVEQQTLSASNTLSDADGMGEVSYQWQRGGSDLEGQTDSTYTLTSADIGTTISVVASYTDGFGANERVTSASVGPILANHLPTGNITIIGVAAEDQTLSVSNMLSDIDGLGEVTYQWQRDGVNIPGETRENYTTTQSDVDSMISVVASYTDSQGTRESVTSSGFGPIANVNDDPTGTVSINGILSERRTLVVDNALSDEDGIGETTYQWQRDGVDIAGATGPSYTLIAEDVGTVITVVASYTDAGGTQETVVSAGVGPIPPNHLPTGSVSISSLAASGQTLSALAELARRRWSWRIQLPVAA